MLVTLALRLNLLVAAYLCTCSSLSMFFRVCGSQALEAYSRVGRTYFEVSKLVL